MSRAALLVLLSSVLVVGCPNQQTTTTTSGSATPTTAASTSTNSTTTSSSGEDIPAPLVSEDGRMQQVDAYGYPMFNPDGTPIWEPTPEEKAQQLFEEALVLSRGVGGAPPNLVGAQSRLKEAITFNESFPEAHYNLGLIELELGAFKDARRRFQKALQYQPDMRDALLALAISSERAGELGVAEQNYLKGQALDSEDVDFLNGIARVVRKRGNAALARDRSRAILEINANSIDAYNTLGLAYMDLDEIELARFVFLKAEASVPGGSENPSIQANLGLVFFQKGDEFEAASRFERAIALDPDHVGASVNLAYLKLQNYDFEGARDLLERAHKRLPNNIPISLDLAVAYSGTGEFQKAEALYEGIASQPGEHQAAATYNLGILYGDKIKDLDAALAQYNKYISLEESAGRMVGDEAPVREYIAEIEKAQAREQRKRERAAKRKAKEEAKRKAAEEAAAAAAAEAAAQEGAIESGSGAPESDSSGEPNGASGGQEGANGGSP